MSDNTAASRYIQSSDGLNMQAQATQQIGQAADAGIAKITDSQQQYFKGVQQNSQNVGALQQQLAQIQIAGAQQPSSLSQLAEGVINGLTTRSKENAQAKAKALELAAAKQKTDAERLKDTQLTHYGAALGDLTDSYEGNNWNNGAEQYKRDASVIIANLPAGTDPDVTRQLMAKVYDNSQARQKVVGDRLAKQQDEVVAKTTDLEKARLMGNLSSITGNILNQSIDEQASPYMTQAQNLFKDFLGTDNGLPYANKLGIIASAVDTINAAYAGKTNRYQERTRELQDWKTYASEYSQLQAKEQAGLISYDDKRNAQQVLNLRYPGMEDKVVKVGDQEREQLGLSQLSEAQRKLREEAGTRAIANTKFTDESVKAMVAGAYADPGFYNTLKNDPNYKDNPQFKQVIDGADKLNDYYKQENQITLQQASVAVQFAKLDFSNIQTIAGITRSIAKGQADKQLTPADQLAQIQIGQIVNSNPALAEAVGLIQNKNGQLTPEESAAINQTLQQESAGIRQIQNSLVQEVQAKQTALYKEYPELQAYGFLGQSQDAVRGYAKNVAPLIEQERQRLDRQRQEAVQAVQQGQYGQQPNFNQSSNYGTSLGDNGKVRVVPRAKAQVIRLPDNSSVVTPIIAGEHAGITGDYGVARPGHKHAGVDFGLGISGKAISLVSAKVVYVGDDPAGYGSFVDILGDNGFLYRYGHTAGSVKVGQRLEAGAVVGVSNNSGHSSGAHLHFEVHPNPKFDSKGNYDVSRNYGFDETTDVFTHLKSLSSNAGNVTQPRYNTAAYRSSPSDKVPINSLLTSGGAAMNGGTYQRLGGSAGSVDKRTSAQRPITMSKAPYKVNVGSKEVHYDYGDNFGYAELEKDTKLRTAFVNTAKSLGIPTVWLVDIARQEAGSLNPQTDHDGNHYGLFGFGSDSFNNKSEHTRLRSGQVDGAGQLKQYAQYMKDNGWDKLKSQKNGSVSIADVWAFTRMGWNMRNKFWASENTNVHTEGSLTYKDELNLLGKWAGRSYSLPGTRSQKNGAVSTKVSSYCPICQQMLTAHVFSPHVHIG